jgi:3-deoxy-7-phosphoheptulonate synthase
MTAATFDPRVLGSELPTPAELLKEIPLDYSHASFVLHCREAVEAILNGWDTRRLLIVGPCSIHDHASAIEYARRLKCVSEQVADQFFIIMRAYLEKPRTIIGWKGLLYDPDIDGSYNLSKGIRLARQLLAELTTMQIPLACELLEINTVYYYADFLTWGCVGARTCASPPHRQLAAALPLPIGFKNSMDGNTDHPIHGILAAAASHVFLGLSNGGQLARIQADGNPFCHLVLRGGIGGPNYDPEAIKETLEKCRLSGVREKLMVDCSHDNCRKNARNQINVFEAAIDQILEGNVGIVGLMLESHLYGGSQEISFPLRFGISITDPCLDWETTERLILEATTRLRKLRNAD